MADCIFPCRSCCWCYCVIATPIGWETSPSVLPPNRSPGPDSFPFSAGSLILAEKKKSFWGFSWWLGQQQWELELTRIQERCRRFRLVAFPRDPTIRSRQPRIEKRKIGEAVDLGGNDSLARAEKESGISKTDMQELCPLSFSLYSLDGSTLVGFMFSRFKKGPIVGCEPKVLLLGFCLAFLYGVWVLLGPFPDFLLVHLFGLYATTRRFD